MAARIDACNDVQAQLAMARVLDAEVDAERAVADAASQAKARLAAAREGERAIAGRAARRAAAIRDAMARRTAADLARIDAAIADEESAPVTQPGDEERIRRAVSRLAIELTGEAS